VINSFFFIIGTRPEAIKLSPVVQAIRRCNNFKAYVCSTGQHSSKIIHSILSIFNIKTDIDLNINVENNCLYEYISKLIPSLSNIISHYHPSWIIVQGDTTSAFVGSMVGCFNNIPVAHVEAGLRTYNYENPYPEELFRIMISRIATIHFSPTEQDMRNLILEGINPSNILISGNTTVDSLRYLSNHVLSKDLITSSLLQKYQFINNKKLVIFTMHRREKDDYIIDEILKSIYEISNMEDVFIICSLHSSPRIQEFILRFIQIHKKDNIFILHDCIYYEFSWLLSHSSLVITDSGGVQEEAMIMRIPVIVIRQITERYPIYNHSIYFMNSIDREQIVQYSRSVLSTFSPSGNPLIRDYQFGDGYASERISKFFVNNI